MNSEDIREGTWRTSSYSNGSGGQCVEVGGGRATVGVRDSKDRTGGSLVFGALSWSSFLAALRTGGFDR